MTCFRKIAFSAAVLIYGMHPVSSFAAPVVKPAVGKVSTSQTCGGKTVVGPTVYIRAEESNLLYLARVDSGATKVSLRAWDFQIDNPGKEMRDNIGKIVRFRTANEKNLDAIGKARIVDTVHVRNPSGVEQRYVIELTLTYEGTRTMVRANLSERKGMTYPLLLGRNWLSGNYLIDVDLPEYLP